MLAAGGNKAGQVGGGRQKGFGKQQSTRAAEAIARRWTQGRRAEAQQFKGKEIRQEKRLDSPVATIIAGAMQCRACMEEGERGRRGCEASKESACSSGDAQRQGSRSAWVVKAIQAAVIASLIDISIRV